MTSLAVSIGDPAGIGLEVTLKALDAKLHQAPGLPVNVHVFAPAGLYTSAVEAFAPNLRHHPSVTLHDLGLPTVAHYPVDPHDFSVRAEVSLRSLEQAASFALAHPDATSLLTAPLDKSVVARLLPGFSGHTGYLATHAGVASTVMLLCNPELCCALLTDHVRLSEVPQRISSDLIVHTAQVVSHTFTTLLSHPSPRFVLAGLNPHAGELWEDAEERRIFQPAVHALRQMGFKIDGPLPADSLYPWARQGCWDVVISPYHDQGLVAVKYPGIHQVVNVTCGLPYLRVSAGHGTALDIAGTGRADPRSTQRALNVALTRRLKHDDNN